VDCFHFDCLDLAHLHSFLSRPISISSIASSLSTLPAYVIHDSVLQSSRCSQVYHKLTSRTALANTGTVFSFDWSSFGLCGRTNHPTDYASLSPCHAKLSQNISSVSRLFQGRRAILRVSYHHSMRRRCAWCSLRRAVCRSRTRCGRDRGLDDGCYAQGAASRRLCGSEARWCVFFLSSSSIAVPDFARLIGHIAQANSVSSAIEVARQATVFKLV
jgi:hypothetical protein